MSKSRIFFFALLATVALPIVSCESPEAAPQSTILSKISHCAGVCGGNFLLSSLDAVANNCGPRTAANWLGGTRLTVFAGREKNVARVMVSVAVVAAAFATYKLIQALTTTEEDEDDSDEYTMFTEDDFIAESNMVDEEDLTE